MSQKMDSLEDLLKKVEDLSARRKWDRARAVLNRAEDEYFFSESLHDYLGEKCWRHAEEYVERCRKPRGYLHGPHTRVGERAQAGLHWILSDKDDDKRSKWRDVAMAEFAGDPEHLFELLRFPELPFDRFSHPVVRERLANFRQQLLAKGFGDEELRALLWKGRKSKGVIGDKIALMGCAFVCMLFMAVLMCAWIGLKYVIWK
jgi:hypothetical protein